MALSKARVPTHLLGGLAGQWTEQQAEVSISWR